jgi:hypothetical protein
MIAAGLAALAIAPAVAQPVAEPGPTKPWYKQPFDPARARPCDRACLLDIGDRYLAAMERHDRAAVPMQAEEVWFTENTARLDLGEGTLWRAATKPTDFRVSVVDPQQGQIAYQIVYMVEGRPALVAIRLKIERRMITEVEQLIDRNVAPEAMELLAKPRPTLLNDLPTAERSTREFMIYAAHSYFDALTGENGKIAPFAAECVRHEQGYQTVAHKTPSRASPSPKLPDPSTEMGRMFLRLSTMTCEQQIDTGVFDGIKKIWPRRMVVDEQKGLVATFPLFIHDGTRRSSTSGRAGLGMVLNMVTMETFAIRRNKIYEVEAFPFVSFAYGLGDGWTPAKAR